MALNAATLASAIKTRLESEEGFDLSDEYCKTGGVIDIIAEEIVSHITNNAVVSSTVSVTSVSGVTVGAGVSGPGAGTATGTVS